MKQPTLLLPLVLLTLLSCQTRQVPTLRIATAANMQFAMEAVTSAFTKQSNIPCDVIISSSGKLTAQIKEGAPYDVFVSADMRYPEILYKDKHTTAPPEIYAFGKLILWSMENEEVTLADLTNPDVKHIALANPKVAPYGKAAMEFLKSKNLYEAVKDKLVFGESIAQVNQFVHTRAAHMGFTALSVIRSLSEKETGHWIAIDPSSYTPIAQGIVLLENDRPMTKEAKAFYDFLFSEKGKEILEEYGYLMKDW